MTAEPEIPRSRAADNVSPGRVNVPAGFDFLLGEWSVERSIDDFRASRRLHFAGTVTVTAEPGTPRTAEYAESGRLHSEAGSTPARRALRYVDRDDGIVTVNFADGSWFLDLDLRDGHCHARHLCASDIYDIDTRVESADRLTEAWRVRGPLKDYQARTVITRQLGPAIAV